MKLSSKLTLGFLAITGLLGAVGYMSVRVTGEVDKLRTAELPMLQSLRTAEVGIWQAIHAANAFHISGAPFYGGLYRQHVGIVDGFRMRHPQIAGARSDGFDAFVSEWDGAKSLGDELMREKVREMHTRRRMLRAIMSADAVIDAELKPTLSAVDRPLLQGDLMQIEELMWELVSTIERQVDSGLATRGGVPVSADLMESQIAAIDATWRRFGLHAGESYGQPRRRFDAAWGGAIASARDLVEARRSGARVFAALYIRTAELDRLINHHLRAAIARRIDARAATSSRIRTAAPLVVLAAVLCGFAICFATTRSIVGRARECVRFAQRLARGEEVRMTASNRRDEFGAIAAALNDMATQLERNRLEVAVLAERRRANEVREAELTSRIREAAALQRANEELADAQGQLLQSEKMAAVGQLAAGVAHEINNPVGFVLSNFNALKEYAKGILSVVDAYEARDRSRRTSESHIDEDGRNIQALTARVDLEHVRSDIFDLLDESREGMLRIKKIVADLKDFSRADAGDWQDVDVHECLESTLNVVASELKYRAIVVKQYEASATLTCLPSQINQVLMNLLVNAAHSLRQDSKGTITITTGSDDTSVWLAVADTGAGIASDVLPRIFNPFFTTKPIGQGTGLGLSISYGIVRKHGGTIEVDSTVGIGSTFTVRLPRRGPAAIATVPALAA